MLQISLLTYTVVTMDSHWDENLSDETQNPRIIFITITWTLSIIYPLTTIVMFIIHCYTSSLAFDVIGKEIKRFEIQIIDDKDQDISVFLSVFKQKNLIICDAVDSINRTFGRMLLLSTTFFFVAIINLSYAIFSLEEEMSLANSVILAYTFVYLPFICFAADHISNKVFWNFLWQIVCLYLFYEMTLIAISTGWLHGQRIDEVEMRWRAVKEKWNGGVKCIRMFIQRNMPNMSVKQIIHNSNILFSRWNFLYLTWRKPFRISALTGTLKSAKDFYLK